MIFGGDKGNWMKVGDDWINLSDPQAISDWKRTINFALNGFMVVVGIVMTVGYFFFDGGVYLCIIGPTLIICGILCLISRIFHRIFWWVLVLGFIGLIVCMFVFG